MEVYLASRIQPGNIFQNDTTPFFKNRGYIPVLQKKKVLLFVKKMEYCHKIMKNVEVYEHVNNICDTGVKSRDIFCACNGL